MWHAPLLASLWPCRKGFSAREGWKCVCGGAAFTCRDSEHVFEHVEEWGLWLCHFSKFLTFPHRNTFLSFLRKRSGRNLPRPRSVSILKRGFDWQWRREPRRLSPSFIPTPLPHHSSLRSWTSFRGFRRRTDEWKKEEKNKQNPVPNPSRVRSIVQNGSVPHFSSCFGYFSRLQAEIYGSKLLQVSVAVPLDESMYVDCWVGKNTASVCSLKLTKAQSSYDMAACWNI